MEKQIKPSQAKKLEEELYRVKPSSQQKLPESSSIEFRHRAEAQLEEQAKHNKILFSEGNPKRVLHELQVHQIELEMQNDELQKVRIAERESIDRYTDLFEFAPIGYFVIELSGIIDHVNLRGESLLGIGRDQLVGQRFSNYITAEHRDVFDSFMAAIFKGKSIQNCEVTVQVDTRTLWLSIEANLGIIGTDCLASIIDITERKELEEKIIKATELVESTNKATNP